MFKFYLDNTLVHDPVNWKDFTETIEFNDNYNLIAFKYNNKLKFTGAAYAYLLSKKSLIGFCYVADLIIISDNEEIFTGKIFISDCKFDLHSCSVECSIADNSYGAFIFNNKSIKVMMYEQKSSKNYFPINPVYANSANYINNSTYLFVPGTGAQIPGSSYAVFIHDAFKLLVEWVSDGLMEFRSDYLNYSLPIILDKDAVKKLMLIKGTALRNTGSFTGEENLELSFDELFKEVNRLYPIILSIEYTSSGKPIIRIEDFDSLKKSNTSTTLNKVSNVRESIDNSLLFSRILIGSPSANYNSSIHSYPPTKQITHQQENYYINGQCNVDIEKNLVGGYICDSNIIEELVSTNTSNLTYDKDIFFLEVEPEGTPNIWKAIKTPNYDDPSKFHYNDNLFNKNVINRNPLANNVSINTGVGINLAENSNGSVGYNLGTQSDTAGVSMPPTQVGPYSNIQYYISNPAVFDGINYTALIAGSYDFEVVPYVQASVCNNRIFNVVLEVRRYDLSNVLKETKTKVYGLFSAVGFYNLPIFGTSFTLEAGDYITTFIKYTSQPLDFTQNSSMTLFVVGDSIHYGLFRTQNTPNNSGVVENNSIQEYFASIFAFDYPISKTAYDKIKSNPTHAIEFNTDEVANKKAWIKNIVRTLSTGETNLELTSNLNNSQ